ITVRPPTTEPMTVRGGLRVLPSQPLRGAFRTAGVVALRPPLSHPACGDRRPLSGVPVPDRADRPDGADRAARASAAVLGTCGASDDAPEPAAPRVPLANRRGCAVLRRRRVTPVTACPLMTSPMRRPIRTPASGDGRPAAPL